MKGLAGRALSVGAAQSLEMALQLLLPMVLVRLLDAHEFGIYRLVWLVVLTISSLVSFAWTDSLFYFLPRVAPEKKLHYVRQTETVLAGGALVVALAYMVFSNHLSAGLADAAQFGPWLVALAVLTVWGQVLDQLPTVDERVRWQVLVLVALSLARAGGTVLMAWLTRDVRYVVIALVALAVAKVLVLQFYLWRFHWRKEGSLFSWARLREQAGQAIPMGTGGLLFHLRIRAEQWLAALLFVPAQYAAFSVASVAAPLVMMARKSVSFVMLPSMSRHHSEGNIKEVLAINNRVNTIIAAVLYPVLAYVLFFAEPLIELVYTRAMVDGAPVMQLLVVTWAVQTVDLNSLTLLLSQGRFTSSVNLAMLCLAVPLSWWGAHHWGLPGVVIGSTLAICVERFLLVRRLSRELQVQALHLQHWGLLAGIAACALSCGVVALVSVNLIGFHHALAKLATAAGIGAVLYAPMLWWLRSRGLLFASTVEGESEAA